MFYNTPRLVAYKFLVCLPFVVSCTASPTALRTLWCHPCVPPPSLPYMCRSLMCCFCCLQGKLAEMKVEKALESVTKVARRSNEPGLRRVSQDLNLVRNSIKIARSSMGGTGKPTAADVEGGVANADAELARIRQTITQMEKAVAAAPAEDRAEIQKNLVELQAAADKMAAVNKLAQGEIQQK